ncbi:MAG TPA: hypothetical protein V6C76_15920 [Drouetiella sp.]
MNNLKLASEKLGSAAHGQSNQADLSAAIWQGMSLHESTNGLQRIGQILNGTSSTPQVWGQLPDVILTPADEQGSGADNLRPSSDWALRQGLAAARAEWNRVLPGGEHIKGLGDLQIVEKSAENLPASELTRQYDRLTPSSDKVEAALTPELADRLAKFGLVNNSEQFRDGLREALKSDNMPLGVMQKRGDGEFPILDGYVAVGAITAQQRNDILREQKEKRNEWRAEHPDADKGAEYKLFQTGELLREKFGKERIDAADELLTRLQK